jgi:hypothetical protein
MSALWRGSADVPPLHKRVWHLRAPCSGHTLWVALQVDAFELAELLA